MKLYPIAARRGWRGYSRVVEEISEFYLRHHAEAEEARGPVGGDPPPTLFELACGCQTPAQLQDLELLMKAAYVIELSGTAALRAGACYRELKTQGQLIGLRPADRRLLPGDGPTAPYPQRGTLGGLKPAQ